MHRALAVLLVFLTGVLAVVVSPPGAASANAATRTVTLPAEQVTYTSRSAPATDFSSSPTAYASASAYSTYVAFPRVELKPGEAITGISLRAYVAYVHGRGKTDFAVIPVANSWQAEAVTHRSQPPAQGDALNANGEARVGSMADLKLDAAQTAAMVEAGAAFRLMNKETDSAATLHAAGSKAPELVVTISAPEVAEAVPASDGDKLVFAHYFPPYPISIDNRTPSVDYYSRHYLVPGGEGGKYAGVGGLLRDRPLPREPLSGDWKLADLKMEVRQAMAAGIDGFAVDILSLEGANWDRTVMLMEAAAEVSPSFRIMLQPDATASAGRASAEALAAGLAQLASYSSAHRLADGRVVISPFKAENKTPAQWRQVLDLMRTRHGVATAFLPVFLDATKMAEYDSLSIGFGNWGTRDPQLTSRGPDWAAQAHALGKLWMQPVAVQDARPNQKLFAEAGNTEMLRASWDKAIAQDADMVMLVTWNDYSEGGHFAPSVDHGDTFLDISRHYLDTFKSGRTAPIVTDAVHITHRIHPHDARPAYPSPMRLWSGYPTAPRDTVEVLTVLRSSATVSVTVGGVRHSYTAPGGVSAKVFPLRTGHSTATVTRTGDVVASVRTKDPVASTVEQQDMAYHAVSSGR